MRNFSFAPAARALLLVCAIAPAANAGMIYFGLAELPGTADPHGDSFVVAIDESETELVTHARALVDWVDSGGNPAESPGAAIVVAEVAAGSDGINRDYLASGEPAWSWQTVGTPSFADWTIEILDGWPTFVESDVPGWMENTNGYIGFWGYTVVAELGSPKADGDFNGDGVADGRDFLMWQRGESPNPLSADDLTAWEAAFGSGLTSAQAATAVSEFSTLGGGLFCVLAACGYRLQRRLA